MTQSSPQPADRYRARIAQALIALEAEHGEKYSLAELARSAAMSPFHFHRVFRALTGQTVGSVKRRFRLARGLRQLRDTEKSVTAIALDVGYESSQNFAKAFKAATHSTPTQARASEELGRRILHGLAKPRLIMRSGYELSSVRVEEVQPFETAAIEHVGSAQGMAAVYQRLIAWAAANHLFPQIKGFFSVYYNDSAEVSDQDFRADACLELEGAFELDTNMKLTTLGGGEHAILLHEGSYETLPESHDALYGRWLPESGREPADKPPFEKYLNDPSTTKPENLRTEIYLPLCPG